MGWGEMTRALASPNGWQLPGGSQCQHLIQQCSNSLGMQTEGDTKRLLANHQHDCHISSKVHVVPFTPLTIKQLLLGLGGHLQG